jgi:hypothetical protein
MIPTDNQDALVTAEEARKLLEGTTPGPWAFVPWYVEEASSAVRAPDGWLIAATSSDADAKLSAAAPQLARTIITLSEREARMDAALREADKRLCELMPNFPPDVGPDVRDAEEIEKTGTVVMQIRATLNPPAEQGEG